MWFILALLSATLGGIRRSGEKRLLSQFDHFTLGWIVQLLALPVVLFSMLIGHQWLNPLHLSWAFWLPLLLVTVGFYPINTWLFYNALKSGELSKVLPIQSLGLILSIFLAWILVGEVPSLFATLAIILITIGLYVIHMNGAKLHNPFRPFGEDKSTLFMLGSTIAVALVIPLDKLAIKASNPLFYTAISTAAAAVVLFTIAWMGSSRHSNAIKQNWRPLFSIGTLQGAGYATFLIALSIGPVAYVNAVKGSSVLIGALTAIFILRESVTRTKIIAFILIASGLTALALSK